MRYFKKLIGEKCYLSPLNSDDIEIFTAWLNDLEVTRNLNLAVHNVSLVSEKAAIERLAQEHAYTIVDIEKDEPIGSVGLNNIDATQRRCMIGIFIGNKDYWGKGYGTEAMRLLLGYAFDYLNMHNVMLSAFEFNDRARACYRKVGFKEIGRRREARIKEGRFYDEILMDLLEEEFRQRGREMPVLP